MKIDFKKKIFKKIKNKKIKIGIVGIGYVGLPLAYGFVKKKVEVIGFDIDKNKIKKINAGLSYINYFKSKDIKFMKKNKFKVTNDFSQITKVDVVILCLPTPLNKDKSPDMSYIKNTLNTLKSFFREGQLLSLESTTYPGTCREVIVPYLNKFKIGKNFFLVYSPEREDPGNKKYSLLKIPKVISGYSKNCLDLGEYFYSILKVKLVRVSSLEVGEFTKLLENIYRSVNIGMVNELKLLCNKMGINIFEIINAAKTKPFGFQAFYPGPGYGGHCIPIDPFLLSWRAKKFKIDTKFIKLSGNINERMPNYILNKVKKILKLNQKRKKVLLLGAAYKKNVDDIRESPSIKLMKLLYRNKIDFSYMDPYVPYIKDTRQISKNLKSIKITYSLIKNYDIVILITDHDKFDYKKILKNSKLILDSRGRFTYHQSDKVIQV